MDLKNYCSWMCTTSTYALVSLDGAWCQRFMWVYMFESIAVASRSHCRPVLTVYALMMAYMLKLHSGRPVPIWRYPSDTVSHVQHTLGLHRTVISDY